MASTRTFWKSFYVWTRNLHLYLGLFISPFLVVFAISTVLLNHEWKAQPRIEKSIHPIQMVEGIDDFAQAKQILAQVGVAGEINFARGFVPGREVVNIPVVKPGERTVVRVNVKDKTAEVERRKTGSGDAMVLLHMLPGPHKRAPNWIFMKIWSGLADATVYLILFLTISGIYMWAVIKAERRAGLVSLGLGVVSFAAIVYGLVAA